MSGSFRRRGRRIEDCREESVTANQLQELTRKMAGTAHTQLSRCFSRTAHAADESLIRRQSALTGRSRRKDHTGSSLPPLYQG